MSKTTAQMTAGEVLLIAWSQTDAMITALESIDSIHPPGDHNTILEERRCRECRLTHQALELAKRLKAVLRPVLTR